MATYYFRNTGDVNWGTASNWSLTDGGGATGAVPTSADDAYFTSNSGNCTVNASARVCKTLIFSGVGAGNYAGTLTLTNGITISGSVTLSASMTISGTGNFNIITTSSLTSNGKTFPNTLIFGSGNPSFSATFIDDWRVGGLTSQGNNATLTNRTIYIEGNVNFSTGIGTGSTTDYVLDGTGDQTLSGAGTVVGGFNINKASGKFTLGNLSWRAVTGKTFKYTTSGSQEATGTLTFEGSTQSATIDTGSFILNNVTFGSSSALTTYTLASNLYASGNVSSALNGLSLNGAYKVYCRGNFTCGAAFNNAGTFLGIEFDGTGNQTYGHTYFTSMNCNVTINKSAGSLILGTTTTQTLSLAANITITHTAGLINPQNTTFNFASGTTYNISSSGFTLYNWSPLTGTHTINTGTITANNNLTLNGNTTFAGTGGWSVANLTDTTAGRILTLKDGSTYTVTSVLSLTGTNASRWTITSSSATLRAIFTLSQGATQSLVYVNGTRQDSSGGQTVWSLGGTLTNTINWNNGTRPNPFNTLRMA